MTELLFSYGTLRQPEMQRAMFGREIDGSPDAIVGRLPAHRRAAALGPAGVGVRVRR